jgi:hypothetical protein
MMLLDSRLCTLNTIRVDSSTSMNLTFGAVGLGLLGVVVSAAGVSPVVVPPPPPSARAM